jgi:cytosine/adenosine deaminase-related metal-dependent hydrolase
MTMTMTMADEHTRALSAARRLKTRAILRRVLDDQAAFPRRFDSDAERFAWVLAEARELFAERPPGLRKHTIYGALAASAFGFSLDALSADLRVSTIVAPRHKVMCFTYLMTDVSWQKLGKLFNRNHNAVIHACRKYADEITPLLGDAIVRRVPKKAVR